MASGGRKRKASSSLPDWQKYLGCPVCLKTIKDPPIYLCERGHGLCHPCRETLKNEGKPCPVCRGKLTDVRNVVVENMLEVLPKIKCKHSGCAFERSDDQLVKTHEDYECKEKLVKCEMCQDPVALSQMFGHLETKHDRKPILKKSWRGVLEHMDWRRKRRRIYAPGQSQQ